MMEESKEMTEDLVDVLYEFVAHQLEQVYTCIPGVINSYDSNTRTANVTLQVQLPLSTGELLELPPIDNVPVQRIETSEFHLELGYPKGTGVMVLFSSVALGEWLNSSSGVVAPENLKKFCLTDAMAIPTIYPKKVKPSTANQVKMVVSGKTLKINTPGGNKFELNGDTFLIEDGSGNTIESSALKITVNGNLEVLQ